MPTATGAPTATAHQSTARPPRHRSRRRGGPGRRIGYVFVAPLMLVFALFYLWPAVATVLSSLFQWSLLRPWRIDDRSTWNFVGTENYRQTLTDDSFWSAALNSLLWLVIFPLLVTSFSLLVAILIWNANRLAAAFRTVFILPMTISLAAAGVIWSFVYNPDPDVGLLNATLRLLHVDFAIEWGPLQLVTGQWLADVGSLNLGFAEVQLVNLSLIVPAFWAFTGFGVITFTAGVASLPGEIVDSARVDGCRGTQLARYVVIPHLRKPIMIVYVVSVIFALRTFDIVYVMTKGGPGEDSMVLALLLWQEAFAFLTEPKAGQAAAIAVLMTVVMVAVAWPHLRNMLRETGKGAS